MSKYVNLVREFQTRMVECFNEQRDREDVCRRYMAEDFECIEPPQLPVGGVFHGWNASLKIMDIYSESWHVECLEMKIYGNSDDNVVAARGIWRWTSKETARSFTAPAVELFTIVDDKIKSIEVFQLDPAGITSTLPGQWKY